MAAGSTDAATRWTPEGPGPESAAFSGGPLPHPPPEVWEIPFGRGDLAEIRQIVSVWSRGQAMPEQRSEELVLAVHELASNSVRHGGGVGLLRLWRDSGTLICEVQDAGHIEDPLIGRVFPGETPRNGRGLWIVEQICDLVQIRSSAQGTTIRLQMALA